MKRRTFLLKSVGTGTVALGGCTSGSSGAANSIESARDTLLENEETFENVSEQFERGETPSFDAEKVRNRVNRANETLNNAEENASGEQLDQIEALRKWGQFQIERAEATELSIRLISKWETVSANLDAGQYEEAKLALSESESIYSDLNTKTDEIKAAYRNVNQEALESGGLTAYDEDITSWFSQLENWLEVMGIFFDGMAPLLDGFIGYKSGIEMYQNERFSQAKNRFDTAQTEFAVATRELEQLEDFDTEFPTLEADSVRIICAAGALKDSAGYMEDSARAAEQGDYNSAEEYANQAEQAANRCGLNDG